MASAAQVLANRVNAQKSTGPRTQEGKAAVSQNAVKHGLLAREAVIKGEDPGQFEFYRDQMLGELAPAGSVESLLAERVVSLSWRLQRAERLQNEAFDGMYEDETTGPFAKFKRSLWSKGADRPPADLGAADSDPARAEVILKDFSNARVLDRLLMYERRIENSLYRTMAELQRQRLLRELEAPKEKATPQAASVVCNVPARAPRACVAGFQPAQDAAKMAATQTPCGGTMNAPIASTGPLANPHPALNEAGIPACREPVPYRTQPSRSVESVGREGGTDPAKQSQSGADRITPNLFIYQGLREEGHNVPPQKQSQNQAGFPGGVETGTLSTAIS
jgi:hypothetical protein